jgi:hypothetical protein
MPIDSHVHFHQRRWIEPTLAAAAANFAAAACPDGSGPLGVLLLAQSTAERVFEWLREQSAVGAWTVQRVPAEPESLWVDRGGARLLVVCGRQISAERGLELLALGTDEDFDSHAGLRPTLARIRAAGALPVLPWGFGKWWGARGELIRGLLAEEAGNDLWLGDNGGRLDSLARPRLLSDGERQGLRTLPGTDPFPFGRDYRRVGSFGCLVTSTVDGQRPWRSLAEQLRRSQSSPAAYGRGAGWLQFGLNQIRIQVHMGLRRTAA